jgi:hypothetical protein
MKRAVQIFASLYTLLCVIAMMLIPASTYGWLGFGRNPVGGTFATILAMPWSLGLRLLHEPDPWETGALVMCAMAANVALLFWLAEILGRRETGHG